MSTCRLIKADCLDVLADHQPVTCIFADPPDNIGLGYGEYKDKLPDAAYVDLLARWLEACVRKADVVWWSFNSRWTLEMGRIACDLREAYDLDVKPCVQVFTFGQHRDSDLGNNHRPLWRVMRRSAKLYPDAIRTPSWRQRNGDKRACAKGRVPGDVFDMQYPAPGDVFDFPRVVGNSPQRCDWHPTQLHEALVERCIKLCTTDGDTVLDIFAGTGTTLRVCKQLDRDCTLIELDGGYCEQIAAENGLQHVRPNIWEKTTSMSGAE